MSPDRTTIALRKLLLSAAHSYIQTLAPTKGAAERDDNVPKSVSVRALGYVE
jgi:hypothetical protein